METSKIISIHQPNYIPWIGYFYKISKADVFVFHDDVQFSKKGMHNYHYIRTSDGPFRLKIPVEEKHGYKINEVRTRDELDWKAKHLKILETNYRQAKFFDEIYSDFSMLLQKDYPTLAILNSSIIAFFCKKFNINTLLINASDLNLYTTREEKVIDIVKALNGSVYYSGTGAMVYQKEENFSAKGIVLKYSDYKPFEYPQLWSPFDTNVTILDFLMNCGYRWDIVLDHQTS